MPKIYNTPGSNEGDRPERSSTSRQMMIAVAVIIALLVLFLLYRFARGMEHPSVVAEQPAVASIVVGVDAGHCVAPTFSSPSPPAASGQRGAVA